MCPRPGCKNTVIAGPRDVNVVHLKAEGGKVVARVSESKLQERGRELANYIQPVSRDRSSLLN